MPSPSQPPKPPPVPGFGSSKARAILLLLVAEVAGMSLWFVSSAILPEMAREVAISGFAQGLLSSAVQAGFVVGALISAVLGIADRFDPRRVFALSAFGAALANLVLLVAPPGGVFAILARFVTGLLLAGVYPVGMKIAVGWGEKDRGFLVGALVGALTLGSAAPHLLALAGGAEWRLSVSAASALAAFAGAIVLLVGLGPRHAQAVRFDPSVLPAVWANRKLRYAYAGYLGHMWELYAMWAWIGTAAAASYAVGLPVEEAGWLAKLTAFLAIGLGAATCLIGGWFADRIGKARVALWSMVASGTAALAFATSFGGPSWITFGLAIIWGMTIIPDSAQFSALVADAAPPGQAGSLMTLQTALGFALTALTVQAVPPLAAAWGWPAVIALMAIGPAFGVVAMRRLLRLSGG